MYYRSIIISDIHFRTRWCKSKELYEFLTFNTCDRLFLNGDVVDTYNLNSAYQDPYQYKCIELIKDHPNSYYIIGNHDDHYFDLAAEVMSGIRTYPYIDYISKDGNKTLIIHGHQYDSHKFFQRISLFRRLYTLTSIKPNIGFIKLLNKIGDYFLYIDLELFKAKAIDDASKRGYNSLIVGHTHCPSIDMVNGIKFYNSGDWTRHCTAIIENENGGLELLWPLKRQLLSTSDVVVDT